MQENFDTTPEELQSLYGLSDGGLNFLEFTRQGDHIIRPRGILPGIDKLRILDLLPCDVINDIPIPTEQK